MTRDQLRDQARSMADRFTETADPPAMRAFLDLMEYWQKEHRRIRGEEDGGVVLGAGFIYALRRIDAKRAQERAFKRRRGSREVTDTRS